MSSNRSRSNSVTNNINNSPNAPKRTRRRRGSIRQQNGQSVNGGSERYSPAVTPARPTRINTQQIPTPEPSTSLADGGMSPNSRYYKNLKVLRRRDAHITSIFDQFAHVTLYYLDEEAGGKYERAGYEGAMFFFERDIEPAYGFFILNRQGMNDYIRHLQPTDIIEPAGEIVWLGTPHGETAMNDEDKTAGLWSMSMDVRESLGDMMKRLHEYIKAGVRYPDEFRYGPDRIAPQQTHYEGPSSQSNGHTDAPPERANGTHEVTRNEIPQASQSRSKQPNQSGLNELEQLFAKLSVPAPDPPPAPAQPLTGQALLNSMFASVSNVSISAPPPVPAPPAPAPAPVTINQVNKGLPLGQHGLAPPPPSHFQTDIISPQPSAAGLPQILTADVIHGLMGLGSDSRSTSRLSSYASGSAPRSPSSAGAPQSRERGYYADRGEDDGSASEASTGLGDTSTNMNIKGENGHNQRLNSLQQFLGISSIPSSGMLKGDATPRARPEVLGRSSPSPLPDTRKRPTGAGHTVSEANVPGKGTNGNTNRKNSLDVQSQILAGRTVSAPSVVRVPFQSGEDLWPDASTRSNLNSISSADSLQGNDAVFELDFSEIGALNNLHSMEAKGAARGRKPELAKQKDRQLREKKEVISTTQVTPSRGKKEKQQRGAANGTGSTPSQNGSVSGLSTPSIKSPPPPSSQTVTSKHSQAIQLEPAKVVRDVSENALVSAILASNLVKKDGKRLERNAFVREVLTLIHTDKSFVDRMYQVYQGLMPESL